MKNLKSPSFAEGGNYAATQSIRYGKAFTVLEEVEKRTWTEGPGGSDKRDPDNQKILEDRVPRAEPTKPVV